MLLCIENDVSIGMIHAQSGVGKTMLSQVLLMNIDKEKYETVLVLVYSEMSRASLLKEICAELGIIEYEDKVLASVLLKMLQDYVMELYKNNRKLVLIIDEAHFLKPECLHTLRTISNIEVPEKKLTTLILIAENRLWRRLQRDSYSSIRSRIYQRVEVPPLSLMDTTEYIKFRLLVAGGSPDVFDSSLFLTIFRASKGICRNINRICYNLMLEAYFRKVQHVDSTILQQVLKKL